MLAVCLMIALGLYTLTLPLTSSQLSPILVTHFVVVLVVAVSVVGVVECSALLGCAWGKGVVLKGIQGGELVKVVDRPDLELCAHIGNQRCILQRTLNARKQTHCYDMPMKTAGGGDAEKQ